LHPSSIPCFSMIPKRTYQNIKEDPDTHKVQLIIVSGLLVLAWLFSLPLIAYIAAAIGLFSLVIPPVGYGIVWGWYKIAEILGTINAKIILSLLYYILVTPMALLFRLSGNDPMLLSKPENSVYKERDYTFEAKDLQNPW